MEAFAEHHLLPYKSSMEIYFDCLMFICPNLENDSIQSFELSGFTDYLHLQYDTKKKNVNHPSQGRSEMC